MYSVFIYITGKNIKYKHKNLGDNFQAELNKMNIHKSGDSEVLSSGL
jgi:hypothetical protein